MYICIFCSSVLQLKLDESENLCLRKVNFSLYNVKELISVWF